MSEDSIEAATQKAARDGSCSYSYPAPSKFLLNRSLAPAIHFVAHSSLFDSGVFHLTLAANTTHKCSHQFALTLSSVRHHLAPSGLPGLVWPQAHGALAWVMFEWVARPQREQLLNTAAQRYRLNRHNGSQILALDKTCCRINIWQDPLHGRHCWTRR